MHTYRIELPADLLFSLDAIIARVKTEGTFCDSDPEDHLLFVTGEHDTDAVLEDIRQAVAGVSDEGVAADLELEGSTSPYLISFPHDEDELDENNEV